MWVFGRGFWRVLGRFFKENFLDKFLRGRSIFGSVSRRTTSGGSRCGAWFVWFFSSPVGNYQKNIDFLYKCSKFSLFFLSVCILYFLSFYGNIYIVDKTIDNKKYYI